MAKVIDKRIKASNGRFRLDIAGFGVVGRTIPVQKSKPSGGKGKGSYVLITPAGHKAFQMYTDHEKSGLYWPAQLGRAIKEEDGTLKPVDEEALEEARTSSLVPSSMSLSVFESNSELHDQLFPCPDSRSHVFTPGTFDKKVNPVPATDTEMLVYDIIQHCARDKDFVLLGKGIISGSTERVYRLSTWREHLVLQPQTFSERMEPHQHGTPRLSKESAQLAHDLMGKIKLDLHGSGSTLSDATLGRLEAVDIAAKAEADVIQLMEAQGPSEELTAQFAKVISSL